MVAKISKKQTPAQSLLDQVEFNSLKAWVQNLIDKNKDIELAFTQHFAARDKQYTVDEVIKLVKDAIKATAGTKKAIDATQLKRLIELWSDVLSPVIDRYQQAVMDDNAFQCFHALIEQCLLFHMNMNNTSSNKISKYVEGLLQASEAPLNSLQNDMAWHKATYFFIDLVPHTEFSSIRMYYLLHLRNILMASNAERRGNVIDLLAAQYRKRRSNETHHYVSYTSVLFDMIEACGLFSKHYQIFKPLHYQNEHNDRLITLLIDHGHLEIAKQFCDEQIERNSRDEFNVPYLLFLKKIYSLQKDQDKLQEVIGRLVPYTFNFEEYLILVGQLSPEEGKKFRTKMLSRARNSNYSGQIPTEFWFKLMDHEKSYKKMIEYIDSNTGYELILKYFELMVTSDKARLIHTLINKNDSSIDHRPSESEKACFPQLFEMLEKYYSKPYVQLLAKQTNSKSNYFRRTNRFVDYMKERVSRETEG